MSYTKSKVLVFIDWYRPAYLAGGPIESIENLVTLLEDQVDFYIITSSKDLFQKENLRGVEVNQWIKRKQHHVLYLEPQEQNKVRFSQEIIKLQPDYVYVNGIYSPKFSIQPIYLAKKLQVKLVVSPRGMLNEGAMKIKALKKKLLIAFYNSSSAFRSTKFHASSEEEKNRIAKVLKSTNTSVIQNVPKFNKNLKGRNKNTEKIKVLFVGRVVPIKNIEWIITIFSKLDNSVIPIEFNIVGPIEDQSYCESLKKLPLPNFLTLHFIGEVVPEKLKDYYEQATLFVSGSKNENFGHTIFQALSFGLPTVVSNQTPWDEINQPEMLSACLPFKEDEWIKAIESIIKTDNEVYQRAQENCFNYHQSFFKKHNLKTKYLDLFHVSN